MIQAVITIKVSSQYQLNPLIQALKALMVSARAEQGLLDCKLYQLVGEETAVCFVEHWQGTDDLECQMRSNRYSQLLALMETAVEKPSMEFNTVTRTQGLDYLQAVRSGGSPMNIRKKQQRESTSGKQ